jgi:iron complex outermembrane recepter protein
LKAASTCRQGVTGAPAAARHGAAVPLLCGARIFLLASLAATGGAGAQEVAPELEQIFVTGSRIARPDFESASPIVSIDATLFARGNTLSVESVVSRLPQFTPDATSTSNNPGNGGQGNVQLRGLGATSTLVLLDGRRLVPANGNGVVDVNVIPGTLVESVEIVSGGASAVYGSDAIAGVVNFKLKEKFNGVQLDGSWDQTDRSDGEQYSIGLTAGQSFADGRGEVYGYVGYADREAVLQGARKFSEVTLGYFGPDAGGRGPDGGFLPRGSPTIVEGRTALQFPNQRPTQAAVDALFATYGYAPGTVQLRGSTGARNDFSFNADGSLFSTGNQDSGSVVNFRGVQDPNLASDRGYSYNFAPWNYLQLPLERVSAFGRASFEINPAVEVYGQVLYADYTAELALAPTAAFPLFLPVTNPYVPTDFVGLLNSRPDPNADIRLAKRLDALGPRVASNQHDALQLTAGARGRVFDDWDYDFYVQTAVYDSTETQTGNALRSKIMELTFAPDGGVAACGGLDLFGAGSVSAQCARYIAAGGTNRAGYDQTIVEASITGSPLALPAGNLGLAFGILYKRDEYFYEADPIGTVFLDDGFADILGFNASDDIAGSDHNTDLYVEALIPVLNGVTAAERLDVVLGLRHSEYASAGGVDSYKAELLWQPVMALRLRSSFQHSVRAPSVFELYQPQLPTTYGATADEFGDFIDPCEARSSQRAGANAAEVEALCLAQGVPADQLAEFEDSDGVHYGVVGGNPDLGAETADTMTVGFVLQSWSANAHLSGMQLSLDWYRIELTDAITQVFANNYVPQCFDARVNPDFDANNEVCRYFSRDPVTHDIADLEDINRNIVGYEVSGIDAQFDWSFDLGPGNANLNWLVSWMDRFETTEVQGLPIVDSVGLVGGNFLGGSLPEWKANLNVSYAWGGLSLTGQWRYIDGMHDRDVPEYEVPSYDYIDAYASYEFGQGMLDGLTLRAAIENLTDDDPPLLPTQVQANTDPSQYDVLGRRYSLGVSFRF